MAFLLDMMTAQLFASVAEEGSIAAAARREAISASAVSRRLSELEVRFNLALFHRHAGGIELTAAGAVVLRRARALLHEAAQLSAELEQLGSGVQGLVRIAASETSLVGYVPDMLGEFLEANPAIRVDLDERLNADVVRAVERQDADLGIYAGEAPPRELWSRPCFRDQIVAVMPRSHPLARYPGVTLAELLDHEIIGQDARGGLGVLLRQQAEVVGRSIRFRVRADGYDLTCRLSQQGLGIGLVAESSAVLFAENMGLATVTVLDSWARRVHRVCLLHGEDALTPAARLMLHHMLRRVEETALPSPDGMEA